MAWHARLTII